MSTIINIPLFFLLVSNLVFSQNLSKEDFMKKNKFETTQEMVDYLRKDIDKYKSRIELIIQYFRETLLKINATELAYKIPKNGHTTGKILVTVDQIDKKALRNHFDGVIAYAAGSSDDNVIHIIVDYFNFKKLKPVEQMATVWHEICHDVFNFKHVKWDELSLMHPNAQPKSESQLIMMLNRMIDNYKHGFIDTFKPNEIYLHGASKSSKTRIFNKNDILKEHMILD